MSVGDAHEAEMMTSLLTGMVCAAVMQSSESLTQPVEFLTVEAGAGLFTFRLASGMLVTVNVHVDPLPAHQQPPRIRGPRRDP